MNKEVGNKRKIIGIKPKLDIEKIKRQILTLNSKLEQIKKEAVGNNKNFFE